MPYLSSTQSSGTLVFLLLPGKSPFGATRTSPAGHGGPEGRRGSRRQLHLIQFSKTGNCIRKFSNRDLRFPKFGFELLRSFCDTLNQLGYSRWTSLSDLKPPEQPDPRFPESRFWPFLISDHGNGPGWYIFRGSTLIKSSGSSFMMYVHLPKFFW